MDLRANTAVDVLIGPFVDKTDGNTTEDGLTLTAAEIKLSKNGQTLTLKNDVTNATFDDDGYYNCELDATDTDTEGNLVLIVHQSANALPVRHEFNVLAGAAWDSLYAAKDAGFMDVNIKTIGRADTQETEANNLETATANYSATRGLTGTALPAVVADGVGGVPISDAGGLDLDAILVDTNELQADWKNTGRLDTILDAIPTTAMRGTDNASTAADLLDKLGAVNEAAAAGDPSATESVMQYVKQIVNILAGAAGVVTMPSAAAPANGVSLAEMIRSIYDDSNELQTDWVNGGRLDLLLDAIQTDLDNGADGLGALKTAIEAVMTTAMTESYNTDGSTATPAQALYLLIASLTEFSISGTTITAKKLDGATTAATYTLDSGTDPTSRTRAS